MNFKNILVLSLAVVFFVSCGKKKESVQQEAAPQKTAETSAPGPTVTSDDAKIKAEAEKAEAEKKAREGRGTVKRDRAGKQGIKKGSHGTKPSIAARDLSLTGGSSKSGLVFTGSSADGTLQAALDEELMKPADQQNRDNLLAASILDMSYLVDGNGQIHVVVEMKKGEGVTKVATKANFNINAASKVIANEGSAQEISVTSQCIDKEQATDSCSNLLVVVAKEGAEATAILRQSTANIHYVHGEVKEANEYATLVRFFENAKLDVESPNKLQGAYLQTFEVVNGKSAYKAVITGTNNQVIAFRGDLVLSPDLGSANAGVDELTQIRDIGLTSIVGSIKDLGFMSSISNTKLVQNSTKGQITLKMDVNSSSTGSKNSLTIQFTRVGKTGQL